MKISIKQVTPANLSELGIFCLKNQKDPGFAAKRDWFTKEFKNGLSINIAVGEDGKQLGFIEYMPSEFAWRPLKAKDYLFIQCLFIYPKKNKGKGVASSLIAEVIKKSKQDSKKGVATFASKGTWMTGKSIYERLGFEIVETKGRFELLVLKNDKSAPDPEFEDWEKQQANYKGWHLVYANQCPYHEKSANVLEEVAKDHNIQLNIKELKTARQAQKSPTGFGVFGLIKDGKVLQDHYISKRRFENIIKKELGL